MKNKKSTEEERKGYLEANIDGVKYIYDSIRYKITEEDMKRFIKRYQELKEIKEEPFPPVVEFTLKDDILHFTEIW